MTARRTGAGYRTTFHIPISCCCHLRAQHFLLLKTNCASQTTRNRKEPELSRTSPACNKETASSAKERGESAHQRKNFNFNTSSSSCALYSEHGQSPAPARKWSVVRYLTFVVSMQTHCQSPCNTTTTVDISEAKSAALGAHCAKPC